MSMVCLIVVVALGHTALGIVIGGCVAYGVGHHKGRKGVHKEAYDEGWSASHDYYAGLVVGGVYRPHRGTGPHP